MKIIRTYSCQGTDGTIAKHYAQVRLDDGSIVEVGAKNENANWLALASAAAPKPLDPAKEAQERIEQNYVAMMGTLVALPPTEQKVATAKMTELKALLTAKVGVI